MLGLIILLIAVAALLGAVSVGVGVAQRAQMRTSLRQLESYEVAPTREREMVEPLSERLLTPVSDGLLRVGRRYTPVGYVETIKRKIVLAGSPPGYEVDRVLVLKVLGAGSGVVWVPLVVILGLPVWLSIVVIAGLWVGSFFLADIVLDRRIDARQREIRRRLPDVLDLLVISVEAGLGFEQALERTTTAVPGPLSDEFRRMLQETRLGAGRADALRALDERTDVTELRAFILAMLQADTFGVSISKVLRQQAAEMRVRRRQRAQELAQKAPIKLLFPLVLCIFPAIFVVVLLPALLQINEAL